jgi:cytoskeletal protein RodZ
MASFIIIGVVIVLVAGGLLYWVRQNDKPARETPVVTTPAPAKEKSDKKDTDKTDSKPQDTTSDTPATTDTAQPAQPEANTSVPQPTVDQLSHTGPADTVMQIIALGALAVAVTSFIRSRKTRSSL